MTYEEQLRDPRWKAKREIVLRRDGHKCRRCEADDRARLNVHHIRYHPGKMAWEYTHYDLITLCDRCHNNEHLKEVGIEPIEGPATVGEILYKNLELQYRKKQKKNG